MKEVGLDLHGLGRPLQPGLPGVLECWTVVSLN